jgi:hypothetical protein
VPRLLIGSRELCQPRTQADGEACYGEQPESPRADAKSRRSASFMVQRSDRWRPYRMVNLGAVGVPDNWRAISAYSAGRYPVIYDLY